MAKKGVTGNPCARIDVEKFNVGTAVRSTLVIMSVLYVPQIPDIIFEICIYFTSWESP